jgi:hypothetical protein
VLRIMLVALTCGMISQPRNLLPVLPLLLLLLLARCSERIWERRVRARWQHWKEPLPASSNSGSLTTRAWRDLYRQRHEVSANQHALLVVTHAPTCRLHKSCQRSWTAAW